MLKLASAILIGGIIMVSCQNPKSTSTASTKSISGDTIQLVAKQWKKGFVYEVEDVGYPLYYLDIEEGDNMEIYSYLFDASKIQLAEGSITDLWNDSVMFTSFEIPENDLMDIQFQGESLLGEYGYTDSSYTKITGIMRGADEPTPGDLPGTLIFTMADGSEMSFSYFITEEIAERNGAEVDFWYGKSSKSWIAEIRQLGK